MNSHFTGGYIGGHAKVRYPQVFDLPIAKNVLDGIVECMAGEHGRNGVGQVEYLLLVRGHFERPLASSLTKTVVVILFGPESAHKRANGCSADHVYGNVGVEHGLDHAYVSCAACTATAKHQAY